MTAANQQCRHCGKAVRGHRVDVGNYAAVAALCPECRKPLWSSRNWSAEDVEMFCGAYPSGEVVFPTPQPRTPTQPFVIPAKPPIEIPAGEVCFACGKVDCSCLLDAFTDTVKYLKTPDGGLFPVRRDRATRVPAGQAGGTRLERLAQRIADIPARLADREPVRRQVSNRQQWLEQVIAEVSVLLPEVNAQAVADGVKVSWFPEPEWSFENGSDGKLRDRDVSPYNTWKPVDRGRWWRNKGTAEIQNPDREMPKPGKPARVAPLVELQMETGGAFGFDESTNPNQLWVCRICGADLKDGQRAYCSTGCANVMEAARARAARAEPWVTRTTGHGDGSMGGFSLDGITIAGLGVIGVEPAVWNALDRSVPVYEAGKPQPWFVPSRVRELTAAEIAAGWSGPASDARAVFGFLLTPDMLNGFLWRQNSGEDTRTPDEWADRLARRYGTGGSPVLQCGRLGCQNIPGKSRNGRRQEPFCSYYCRDRASLDSWECERTGFKFPVGRTALMGQDGTLREPFRATQRGLWTWVAA